MLIICNEQGTWLVCSNLVVTLDLSMVTINFDNLQCAWHVMANSGPAKIYPLIYHQVLHVDNLQCPGHVADVLYSDSEKWTSEKLYFDLSPGSSC